MKPSRQLQKAHKRMPNASARLDKAEKVKAAAYEEYQRLNLSEEKAGRSFYIVLPPGGMIDG